jgi:lysozyme family protein
MINDDLTLNRNNATYISNGRVRQLTKDETYQYFTDEYWTPFSMPAKYWDESWRV